jgi:hypothetical protein
MARPVHEAAKEVAEEEELEGEEEQREEGAAAPKTSRFWVERTSRAPCSLSCKL